MPSHAEACSFHFHGGGDYVIDKSGDNCYSNCAYHYATNGGYYDGYHYDLGHNTSFDASGFVYPPMQYQYDASWVWIESKDGAKSATRPKDDVQKTSTQLVPQVKDHSKMPPKGKESAQKPCKATEPKATGPSIKSTDSQFIDGLGIVLSSWVKAAQQAGEVGRFHSACAPKVSIGDYLKRIHKFFQCSDECFVIALIYIDRASKVSPTAVVCDVTVHRLLSAAVMLAAKFQDDFYYSNAHYAKVCGMTNKEANMLEEKMLGLLEWKLNIQAEVYELYHNLVCEATNPKQ
jgi:hypothetical protein